MHETNALVETWRHDLLQESTQIGSVIQSDADLVRVCLQKRVEQGSRAAFASVACAAEAIEKQIHFKIWAIPERFGKGIDLYTTELVIVGWRERRGTGGVT